MLQKTTTNTKKNINQNEFSGTIGIWLAAILIVLILIPITGCISKSPDISENSIDENQSPSETTDVAPAPWQTYIKAGKYEQFVFWGNNITIDYISAYPVQIIEITFNGSEKIIRKELTDSPGGVYWTEGNISFNLKPVVWEKRDTQMVPIYESTWNTSEIFIAISADTPAQIPGGPLR